MKTCIDCNLELDVSMFNSNGKNRGLKSHCKECQKIRHKRYAANNPESLAESWRNASQKYYTSERRRAKTFKSYGLTVDDFNILWDSQQGLCKLCGRKKPLVIDHDHKTGKVRGLLCTRCNISIGGLGDTVESLTRAVEYLKGNLE
jgi:hypothetical protein